MEDDPMLGNGEGSSSHAANATASASTPVPTASVPPTVRGSAAGDEAALRGAAAAQAVEGGVRAQTQATSK